MRLAGVLLFASLPAWAASEELQRCAGITEDAARLACYDTLAGQPSKPVATAAVPTPASAPQDFGAEQLHRAPDETAPAVLHSRILGDFSGWDPKTRFVLENGQVWQNIGDGSVYFRAHDPAVSIEKSAFGGYWLQVEGLSTQTRVRRIR